MVQSVSPACRECQVLRQHLEKAEHRVSTSQQMYKEITGQIHNQNTYIKKLEARLALGGFQEECEHLQKELEQGQKTWKQATDRIEELEHTLFEHASLTERLKSALTLRAQQLGTTCDAFLDAADRHEEIDSLRATIEHAREEADVAHTRIRDLTSERSRLQAYVAELEQALRTAQSVNATTLDRFSRVQDELEEITEERKSMLEELERLHSQVTDMGTVKQQLLAAQEDAEHHRTCWGIAERERQREREAREQAECALRASQDETHGTAHTEEAWAERLRAVEGQLQDCRSQLEQAHKEHHAQVMEHTRSFTAHEYTMRALERDNGFLQTRVHTLEGHLAESDKALSDLRKVIQESELNAETSRAALTARIQELQDKERGLSATCHALNEETRTLRFEVQKYRVLNEHYNKMLTTKEISSRAGSHETQRSHSSSLRPYLTPASLPATRNHTNLSSLSPPRTRGDDRPFLTSPEPYVPTTGETNSAPAPATHSLNQTNLTISPCTPSTSNRSVTKAAQDRQLDESNNLSDAHSPHTTEWGEGDSPYPSEMTPSTPIDRLGGTHQSLMQNCGRNLSALFTPPYDDTKPKVVRDVPKSQPHSPEVSTESHWNTTSPGKNRFRASQARIDPSRTNFEASDQSCDPNAPLQAQVSSQQTASSRKSFQTRKLTLAEIASWVM